MFVSTIVFIRVSDLAIFPCSTKFVRLIERPSQSSTSTKLHKNKVLRKAAKGILNKDGTLHTVQRTVRDNLQCIELFIKEYRHQESFLSSYQFDF